MAKITLSDLVNLSNPASVVAAINANNALIEAAIEKTLSRDGTSPNQMADVLDMNSYRIINLPAPTNVNDALRLSDLEDFIGGELSISLRETIPCTATWINNAGFGQYTLTAVGYTVPASLPTGTRISFLAPATSDTGRIQAFLTGVTAPGGFLTINGPDGQIALTFHDIQEGDFVTLELRANSTWSLVSSTLSRTQGVFTHGTVNISAGGFMGTANGQIVAFGPFNGGNIFVKDQTTGGMRIAHIETSGIATSISDGTAYVEGVLGTVPDNEFWFVYCFLVPGTVSDLRLNFSQTTSGNSHLGHQIMEGDDRYTYLGMIYTLNGDIGFNGTGSNPQVLVRSIFNHFQLPIMATDITVTGVVSATFADVPTATTAIVIDAVTKLPSFTCICNYANDTSGAGAEMRLKIAGISVAADGTQTPFTSYSATFKGTCPGVNKYTQIIGHFGAALDTGYIAVTPQIRVLAGTGLFEITVLTPDS